MAKCSCGKFHCFGCDDGHWIDGQTDATIGKKPLFDISSSSLGPYATGYRSIKKNEFNLFNKKKCLLHGVTDCLLCG